MKGEILFAEKTHDTLDWTTFKQVMEALKTEVKLLDEFP